LGTSPKVSPNIGKSLLFFKAKGQKFVIFVAVI